jgi:hypothetical protein
MALQKPFRPLDPPPDRGHESRVEGQVHGDAGRRACCRKVITRAHALRVCSFPCADRHIKATRGVRRIGQQGKVRPTQRRACVRFDEQVVSLLPLAPP